MDIATRLHEGCIKLDLNVSIEQEQQLLAYLALLQKWNTAYNLTAIRDGAEMVVKHLLDSLSILPFVPENSRIIDVGTGAGLPGIVLAITRPDCQLTLLDSNGKKIRFLRQVIADLKLVNAEVVQSRVEAFTGSFDIVTSRAFASLTDMVIGSTHLLHDKGLFLAMKGQEPAQEIAALPTGYAVKDMVSLHVPFLQEERHLLRLIKTEKR